jgi:hypothetical protein
MKEQYMTDYEYISKLIRHLPPVVCRTFLAEQTAAEIPDLNTKEKLTAQRALLTTHMAKLSFHTLQKLEEICESIALLSDGPEQDVIEGIKHEINTDKWLEAFSALRNPYEKSLWFFEHEPRLFDEALNSRQADLFRQSQSCYSGFLADIDLILHEDEQSKERFHEAAAAHFGCPKDEIAIQVFRRLRTDTSAEPTIALYQVSIHYNRPPEIVEYVQHSELLANEVVRAISSHITYEPDKGYVEVLSKDTQGRDTLAAIVAETLLASPITGESVPIKQYEYQSLAAPRNFDISNEPVTSVKVLELGYAGPVCGSSIAKVSIRDPQDIYSAAKSLYNNPAFEFREYTLNYAKISIKLRNEGRGRARTITIELRGNNRCNIKTKREKDRALCDDLLHKWNLVKEVSKDARPIDPIAA